MDNSVKLCECECGCGEPVPIADRTRKERNHKKGEPYRFIHGHRRKTRFCPRKHDTFIVGRTKFGRCIICDRKRKRIKNMTQKQIISLRESKKKYNKTKKGKISKKKYNDSIHGYIVRRKYEINKMREENLLRLESLQEENPWLTN